MTYDVTTAQQSPLKHLLRIFAVLLPIAILLILFFDQNISKFLGREELHWFWQLNRDYTNIALSENYFALSLVAFLLSKFVLPRMSAFQNSTRKEWVRNLKNFSINLFISLVTSGIFLHIFKNIFGRQRPHISNPEFNAHVFKFFNHNWDNQSMPSGHAQVSFTVACVLATFFPKQSKFIFAMACVLAFTRIATLDHFASDVIAGSFLGYAGALTTMWFLKTKTQYGVKNSHWT